MELTGKTALVTGASRGIGKAIAMKLAAKGAVVGVHYGNNETAAKETARQIAESGGEAFLVRAELGVDGDIDNLFTQLEKQLPDGGLDILVNNAARVSMATLDNIDVEEFERTFAINVRAPLFIIQRAVPLLRDNARIVNISSLVTRSVPEEIAYVLSKGAVDVLGRCLAPTLGPRGITVNTVAPGLTATDVFAHLRDMPEEHPGVVASTALSRIGQPADIADVVAFLATPSARWITGQVIDATGGMFLRLGVDNA